jgi:hypothetical protein
MNTLEKAQAAAATAAENHDREAARLAATHTEIEELTEQIRLTDPDDSRSFARLVTARDAARGRS